MKILMITPVVPTQTDGRRPYNFLKYLTRRHQVHLVTMRMAVQTDADVERLRELGARIEAVVDIDANRSIMQCATGLLWKSPLRVSWCRSRAVREAIQAAQACERFDIAHIDRMRMGQYAPLIEAPIALDYTDSLPLYLRRSLVFRTHWKERLVDWWELKTIPHEEKRINRAIDIGLVCSSVDAQVYRDNDPSARMTVIENAVDTDQFKPRRHEGQRRPRLIITGTLFYFPNIDSVRFYVKDILPLLRQRIPWIETLIIGTRPVPWIRELDGRDGIQVFPDVPRMEEHLYCDDILLCPLRVAAGVRNKLLEAMSAKMPVITTALGAEGMQVEPDREVLFAETPEEFASQIERLLDSRELCERLGEAGRQYVKERHAHDAVGRKLVRLYEDVIEARSATNPRKKS